MEERGVTQLADHLPGIALCLECSGETDQCGEAGSHVKLEIKSVQRRIYGQCVTSDIAGRNIFIGIILQCEVETSVRTAGTKNRRTCRHIGIFYLVSEDFLCIRQCISYDLRIKLTLDRQFFFSDHIVEAQFLQCVFQIWLPFFHCV